MKHLIKLVEDESIFDEFIGSDSKKLDFRQY